MSEIETETESVVLCGIESGVATLTLNRPQRRNAFTWEMGARLDEYLCQSDADDSVRAIVVTGAGTSFCAGADLAGGEKTFRGDDRPRQSGQGGDDPPDRLEPWQIRKPIIAAINGAAVGVGLTMAMRYDLRIAARDAKLAFAFVRRGVMPELSSTWILPRLIGVARANDLLLTGRTFLGDEAAALGVVNEAVDRDDVLPRALELAHEIVTWSAPASVAHTKRVIWDNLGEPDPGQAARNENRSFWWLGRQADAREGVVSFLEKRAPAWTLTPSSGPDDD